MQLEARGQDVYFIDILPGRQLVQCASSKSISIFSKFDKYVFKRIENYILSRKMSKIHVHSYECCLETIKQLPQGACFDLVIIGSDEVFNATTPSKWGFSTQLFGDIKNAKRVVTYAASCGSTTLESARQYGIEKEIYQAMRKLEHISVRDGNTAEFVEGILHKTPNRHIDPVFISDYDVYIPKQKKRNPYMLVYAYPNRIYDVKEIEAIQSYAKERNLDVICVGMQQRWCSKNIAANAFELLAYVKNADCVVTDTFHGTVFSIKYNKRFVWIIGAIESEYEKRERYIMLGKDYGFSH